MELIVICALIGLLPAYIAHTKGHSFAVWWFYGAALFIVALPHALLIRADARGLESQLVAAGERKCPFCAEWIKVEAIVCRHCGRDLPQAPPPPPLPPRMPTSPSPRVAIPSGKRPCPLCGQAIALDAYYCKHCNRNLPTDSVQASSAANSGVFWKVAKFAVLGVVTIFALAVVAFLISGPRPRSTAGPSSTPTQQAPTTTPSRGAVTMANFQRLQTGMTYSEVVQILGSAVEEMSRTELAGTTTVMYMWKGRFGANMNAMFQNGELVSKAQFGLP